jgi:hypothetical protein
VVLALVASLLGPNAVAQGKSRGPGYVDGSQFLDLVGDENVVVEVSLGRGILRPIVNADPDLFFNDTATTEIYTLILDLSDPEIAERVREQVLKTERRLTSKGWERIARIQDEGAQIKILVLLNEDEETISGLIVMVLDADDDEPVLVFANVAGVIDLAALEELGEAFDVPGLEDIELDD